MFSFVEEFKKACNPVALFQLLQELIFPDLHFLSAVDFVLDVLLGEVQFAEEELVVFVHVEHQLAFLKQLLMADGERLFLFFVQHYILFFVQH